MEERIELGLLLTCMICIWQITGQIKDFGKMAVMVKGDIAGFLFEASMLFF